MYSMRKTVHFANWNFRDFFWLAGGILQFQNGNFRGYFAGLQTSISSIQSDVDWMHIALVQNERCYLILP